MAILKLTSEGLVYNTYCNKQTKAFTRPSAEDLCKTQKWGIETSAEEEDIPLWVREMCWIGREDDSWLARRLVKMVKAAACRVGGLLFTWAMSMCSFAPHFCVGPVCLQLRHGSKHSQPSFTPLAFQPSPKQPLKPTSIPFHSLSHLLFCPLFYYIKHRNKGSRTKTLVKE